MKQEEFDRYKEGMQIMDCINRIKSDLADLSWVGDIRIAYEKNGSWYQVRNLGEMMLKHIKDEVIMHLEAKKNELTKQFDEL